MLVKVNGKDFEIQENSSIRDLLKAGNLKGERVIIELNGEIVRREQWESRKVSAGDSLEIIQILGGG